MMFHVEQLYKLHFKKIMEDSNRRFFVKDHAVTREEFELQYHKDLDLLETIPRPKADQLDRYYESEDYISHTQTMRNIIELGYRLIRKITLRTKLKLINSCFNNLTNMNIMPLTWIPSFVACFLNLPLPVNKVADSFLL